METLLEMFRDQLTEIEAEIEEVLHSRSGMGYIRRPAAK
jgi:hypothetical protein